MPDSMTAFARVEDSGEWGQAAWELRSVNHRYLDLTVRLPEELRPLESAVRERVGATLKRGKVECGLRYEAAPGVRELCVNTALAKKLIQLAGELPLKTDATPQPMDVLRWPGVIEKTGPNLQRINVPMLALLDRGLEQLQADRRREGEALGKVIAEKCEQCLRCIRQLRDNAPTILDAVRERYLGRIRDLSIVADNGRLEQELALLLQKLDVAEELDRAQSHACEVRRLLAESGPMGRRLDFLMQEMNREANTLGAKSAHIDTSNASIELKTLVEQMREQAQNIE